MKDLKESAESIRLKQQCTEMGIDNLVWDSMIIRSGKLKTILSRTAKKFDLKTQSL